ncbi:MAG: HlyU family transcriptional regulator [Hyphomicrobiaceae bacterium]
MVSFLKKMLGLGPQGSAPAERGEPVQYQGFEIQPAPEPEGSQWRLAGYILGGSEDNHNEQRFVRADLFASRDEASEFAIRKGKQIIDEQGSRLFADDEKTGSA